MNITKQQIDDLNAVITINIDKSDYIEEVNKELNNYRKNVSIPGFRKGHVPISIIKKRFENAIIFEQINKIIQESLSNYIKDEKIDILCDPIPSPKNDINLSSDSFSFDFEIGLMPEFSVDLNIKDNPRYEIKLNEKLVDKQIENFKNHYAKLFPKEQFEIGDELTCVITNMSTNFCDKTILSTPKTRRETIQKFAGYIDKFMLFNIINDTFGDSRKNLERFVGKKVGDVITFSLKELATDDTLYTEYLPIDWLKFFEVNSLEDSDELENTNISFTISEINGYQPAEITKEIIDDLTDKKSDITNEEELRQRIRDNHNTENISESEQKFFDDTFDILIKNTKFDLPSEFLKKWLQHTSEKPLTDEQAEQEYNNTEKYLRYQIIEEKIIKENNLKIEPEEIQNFAKVMANVGLLQSYTTENITNEQIDEKAKNMLSDKKEFKRLIKTILYEKMLSLFLEKTEPKIIEVTLNEFIEISKKEKK